MIGNLWILPYPVNYLVNSDNQVRYFHILLCEFHVLYEQYIDVNEPTNEQMRL